MITEWLVIASTFRVPCLIEVALTHFPIVGDARVCGSVDHARRRGHGQEVAAVAVVAAASASVTAGGVGRHLEVPRREEKAAHARTTLRTNALLSLQPLALALPFVGGLGNEGAAAAALSVCTGRSSFSKKYFEIQIF